MESHTIICFDIGTSNSKCVIKIDNQFQMSDFKENSNINEIIQTSINDFETENVIITGSNSRIVENTNNFTYYDELDCIANIIKNLGKDKGLVVNIGTGTAFVQYENSKYQHLIGTGIGGGTFSGLGKMLLNISDPKEIEALAINGELSKVNTQIGDISYGELSWFQNDITVANFSKTDAEKPDIALGIHSLVAEPIMSILKSFILFHDFGNIIFSGRVVKNNIIQKIINKYAEIFDMKITFLDNPEYGTCFGAIAKYEH